MKTILFAFLALLGATMFAPEAQAGDRHHYRHGRHYHHGHSYVRAYPRYYTSYPRYYRPYRSYYYSSYPSYNCYPRTYYRRPGLVVSFGF